MTTTRERILSYIERNHTATSTDISNAMGLSRANIRYHLNILVNQGLVELVGKRKSNRKGRRDLIFGLSKFVKGSNLDILSNALLHEIKNKLPEKKDEIYREIAFIISNPIPTPGEENIKIKDSKQLSQKLLKTVEQLDNLNYRPHWEAHVEGPRIILKNCPYQQIELHHPDICLLDKYLIELLLHENVNQIGKLELDERSISHCIFEVIIR
ncbi:MAG: ArsR family transcriptional regulator [Anaerolineales bacterium]|jgi:predicted ArsR family transcriptional regulator